MPIYDKGDAVRCVATFVNTVGVPLDPASVYYKIITPQSIISTYVFGGVAASIIKDGVGAYHVDYTPSMPGNYTYRFESGVGNPGQAAADSTFVVNFTPF